jgi:nicotinamide-nucleotide amidase
MRDDGRVTVELVAIGSELLLGQIVDSNSAWMAQRLAEVGTDLFRKTTVGDNLERMVDVLGGALARADCVITGGGLGPTEDDLTRQAVAQAVQRPLERHAGALRDLQRRFRSRGFVLTPNNEKQALLPRGATLVHNPNGTAPAFIVEDQRGTVISLPGVPFEMKWLLEHEVVPYLRRRWGLNRVIHHRVLKVGELGESAVDHRIGAIMTESANPKVGVLARPGQVDVRISARADSPAAARALIAPTEARVRAALGDHIFAADEETLESVVAAALARHGWSVASYEDRTGGTVAAALHDAAGERFVEGRIVTTAAARTRLAEAGGEIAETPGGALAAAMARAVCRVSGADLALAVHACDSAAEGAADEMAGAATAQNLGPGNTWLAVAGATGELGHHLGIGVRGQVDRRRAAVAALSLLRRALL